MTLLISFLPVGIILLLFVIALFTKKGYNIHCEIIINAPIEKVFEYIKQLKNWDNFNERAAADPNKKEEFIGTDGTIGFIYKWWGNKRVGEGEKEITAIVQGETFEWEIRFTKPFTAVGSNTMITERLCNNKTKVTMANASKIKFPFNIMLLVVKKMIAKDMGKSLSKLKIILEEH